uniref:Uncharacterized protein n=1 Tax=viral metagenome TaxID=1070528 RepID=A0A6M3KA56_9ZZZZ
MITTQVAKTLIHSVVNTNVIRMLIKGGQGSGNFGHSGRVGEVGGLGGEERAICLSRAALKSKGYLDENDKLSEEKDVL